MQKLFTYAGIVLTLMFFSANYSWAQPANDVCTGAIPITPSAAGTGCGAATFTLPFASDGTTDSGMDGTCNGTSTGYDQFFTWTATSTGLLWNDASPGNPGIVIWSNTGTTGAPACGAQIDCEGTFAATDATLGGWAINDLLIIQIYDFGSSASTIIDVAFCLEEYTPPPPPPNDDCSGVIDLGTQTSPLVGNTCAAGNDFVLSCLTNVSAPDVVYSIDVPDGSTLTIGQSSNTYDSKHRLAYGGGCPGTTEVACTDDPDTQTEEFINTTGSTQTVYWVQSAFSTGCGDYTLEWSISACIAPVFTVSVDDSACPAISLVVDVTSLGGATSVDITPDAGPDSETGVGIGMYTLTGYTVGDPAVNVTVADNANAACNDVAAATPPSGCPPGNDVCAAAIGLSDGVGVAGTTVNSTDGDEPAACGTSESNAGGVWYSITADDSQDITVDVCTASFDTKLFAYSGGCGAPVCVVGNDDDCGTRSTITIPGVVSAAPVTYLIYVTGFSANTGTFTITANLSPLPVELVSFTGSTMKAGNKLAWTTATEFGVEYFAIEKSHNGIDTWREVGRVDATGNSTTSVDYELMDENPLANGYYRLRTVDFDRSEQNSEIINLVRDGEGFTISNAFPNPTKELVNVQFNSPINSTIEVSVMDITGKLVQQYDFEATDGFNNLEIQMSGLATGTYFLSLSNEIERIVERIVKQ